MATPEFIKETLKVESAEVALVMLKLSHEDWADDIRIVGNTSAITSGGELYEAYGVSFAMPSEGEAVRSTITIEDITRVLASSIRSVLSDVSIEVFVVMSSDVNTVELEVGTFAVTNVSLSNYQLKMQIEQKTVLKNNMSSNTINPTDFPGVFLL